MASNLTDRSARFTTLTGWSAAHLMEFSERRVAYAAKRGLPAETQVAARLLESLRLYRCWEQNHGQWMQAIATPRAATARVTTLRRLAFQSIHRKAPFAYLRDQHITGAHRRRLVRALFATDAYAQCVVREHVAYICASCSLLCADTMCARLRHGEAYCELLEEYNQAYAEYYRIYCDAQIGSVAGTDNAGGDDSMKSLLPYLRYQLGLIREQMLSDNADSSDFKYLRSLYAPLGDTQKLTVLPMVPAGTART